MTQTQDPKPELLDQAGQVGDATPRALDETARRRPDFRGGETIVLGDGREWYFPPPTLGDFWFRPGPDGRAALSVTYSYGPAYEELIDRYVSAEDGMAELLILVELAWTLLAHNYDLTQADLRVLLPLKRPGSPGGEANSSMWNAIAEVAFGRSPKGRIPDGSGSHSG